MSRELERAASLNLLNFIVCADDLATCGRPTPGQLLRLPEFGFEAVINLLPIDSQYAMPEEEAVVRSAGLEYTAIPVLFDWPSMEDLVEFCDAIENLAGRRVLVHCAVNCRGTFFVACYLMLQRGMDPDLAVKIVERVWCPLGAWKELWGRVVLEKLRGHVQPPGCPGGRAGL